MRIKKNIKLKISINKLLFIIFSIKEKKRSFKTPSELGVNNSQKVILAILGNKNEQKYYISKRDGESSFPKVTKYSKLVG